MGAATCVRHALTDPRVRIAAPLDFYYKPFHEQIKNGEYVLKQPICFQMTENWDKLALKIADKNAESAEPIHKALIDSDKDNNIHVIYHYKTNHLSCCDLTIHYPTMVELINKSICGSQTLDKLRVFALQTVVFLNDHGCVAHTRQDIYHDNAESI